MYCTLGPTVVRTVKKERARTRRCFFYCFLRLLRRTSADFAVVVLVRFFHALHRNRLYRYVGRRVFCLAFFELLRHVPYELSFDWREIRKMTKTKKMRSSSRFQNKHCDSTSINNRVIESNESNHSHIKTTKQKQELY
jgi:hypothetical protein